jgi:hypothetical protein
MRHRERERERERARRNKRRKIERNLVGGGQEELREGTYKNVHLRIRQK